MHDLLSQWHVDVLDDKPVKSQNTNQEWCGVYTRRDKSFFIGKLFLKAFNQKEKLHRFLNKYKTGSLLFGRNVTARAQQYTQWYNIGGSGKKMNHTDFPT